MANKAIKKMQDTAENLYNIRHIIEEKENEFKKDMDVLKTERDAIQAILLTDMKKNSLASLKVLNGDSFFIGKRKGVDITNEAQAFKWAYEQKAVSINKIIVAQILKESKEIPVGFELTETEFISVRKPKLKE